MADAALRLTIPEAGFVLDQSSKTLNQAIDRGEIDAMRTKITRGALRQKVGGARLKSRITVKKGDATQVVREIGSAELRFLALTKRIKFFSTDGRKQIYGEIKRLPADANLVKLGPMALELSELDKEIAPRLTRLLEVRSAVETRNGVQVLAGTETPVYAVAALKAKDVTGIQRDYPSLTVRQIQAALDYAKIYPKAGRPYPTRSMKDAIATLAESGVFDDVDDLEPLSPAMVR